MLGTPVPLLVGLDDIAEREVDKLNHAAGRLLSFLPSTRMRMTLACATEEFFIDMWHHHR